MSDEKEHSAALIVGCCHQQLPGCETCSCLTGNKTAHRGLAAGCREIWKQPERVGEHRVAASISMKEWECVGVFPGKCGRDAPHTGGRKVTCGFRRAALSDERGATMKIAFVQP